MYTYLVNIVNPSLYIFAEDDNPLFERTGVAPHVISMALVIGKDRAALIDTGLGKGDLVGLVRKYTDKPVTLLITHGDTDHCKVYSEFEDRYMCGLDEGLLGFEIFTHKELEEGQVFDLGGIELETYAVPGHSKGSFCFYDRKNNNLFTGDAINRLPWLFLDRCTTLSVYRDSLVNLRGKLFGKPDIYCGHSLYALPYETLTDSVTACNEVLNGDTKNDYPYFMPFAEDSPILEDVFEHQVNDVRLIYNAKKL